MTLEWIDGPRVYFDRSLRTDGGACEIFWPANEGCLIDDYAQREKAGYKPRRIDYPTPGVWGFYPGDCQMQYLALLGNEQGGVYLGAHDAAHGPKGVEIFPAGDSLLRFAMQVFCGGQVKDGAYEMDFDIVLASLQIGNWMQAALVYRDWMEKDDHSLPVKLHSNSDLPDWYVQSPVVVAYPVRGDGDDKGDLNCNEYYPYTQALPVIEKLGKEFNSKILALLMHWEGTAPWAPPYVWPPLGGEQIFYDYVQALHEIGHLLGVYCSGTGWTQTSSILQYSCEEQFQRENLDRQMCVGPEGQMYSVICNGPKDQGQRIGFDMCVDRQWVGDTVLREIEKVIQADVDYLQFFDQNMGGGPALCWSKDHGHPSVPGCWHTDAMLELLEKIKHATSKLQTKPLIGCEAAAAHPFISGMLFNDLRFNLNWQWGKSVPAYGFIFHEYVNNFMGNQVCTNWWIDHEKCPSNLLFRIAYTFSAGDMLSVLLKDHGDIHWDWVNKWSNTPPVQQSVIDLVRNLNIWRVAYPEYLCFGKIMIPDRLDSGRGYQLIRRDGTIIKYDSVLSSKWESIDGHCVQFLVNFLPQEQSVTFQVEPGHKINFFTAPDVKGIVLKSSQLHEIMIAPLSAVMLESSI